MTSTDRHLNASITWRPDKRLADWVKCKAASEGLSPGKYLDKHFGKLMDADTKRCESCHKDKPLSLFITLEGGRLSPYCEPCIQAWLAADAITVKDAGSMRHCGRCGKSKPIASFLVVAGYVSRLCRPCIRVLASSDKPTLMPGSAYSNVR